MQRKQNEDQEMFSKVSSRPTRRPNFKGDERRPINHEHQPQLPGAARHDAAEHDAELPEPERNGWLGARPAASLANGMESPRRLTAERPSDGSTTTATADGRVRELELLASA